MEERTHTIYIRALNEFEIEGEEVMETVYIL